MVTHDYGKDAAGLSGDALHQALVKEITAANKEREDTRKSLAALTQEMSALTKTVNRLDRRIRESDADGARSKF
mgnify:CR=1 FL=1